MLNITSSDVPHHSVEGGQLNIMNEEQKGRFKTFCTEYAEHIFQKVNATANKKEINNSSKIVLFIDCIKIKDYPNHVDYQQNLNTTDSELTELLRSIHMQSQAYLDIKGNPIAFLTERKGLYYTDIPGKEDESKAQIITMFVSSSFEEFISLAKKEKDKLQTLGSGPSPIVLNAAINDNVDHALSLG
ncbi:MAG: hypothetical protein ACI9IL_000473 [Rickettsiales bacterium]